MKIVILASLLASAAAFAPAAQTKQSSALNADFSKALGAQAPLGYWDPLDLAQDDQDLFDQLRYVELKHGRVAMLAVSGYLITQAGFRFPGCEDVGPGFKALMDLKTEGWLFIAFTTALLEMANRDATGEAEFMGDFRNGFDFGWDAQSDEWKLNKRAIELNNGRAAQMGIVGLMTHEAMGNLNEIIPI